MSGGRGWAASSKIKTGGCASNIIQTCIYWLKKETKRPFSSALPTDSKYAPPAFHLSFACGLWCSWHPDNADRTSVTIVQFLHHVPHSNSSALCIFVPVKVVGMIKFRHSSVEMSSHCSIHFPRAIDAGALKGACHIFGFTHTAAVRHASTCIWSTVTWTQKLVVHLRRGLNLASI